MSPSFFRTLWKFNAVSIAVLSLIGILIGLSAVFYIAKDIIRTKYRLHDTARITRTSPAGELIRTELDVQRFRKIAGTNTLYAPIEAEQKYDYSYSSKGVSSTRNWIFFDLTTGKSAKLLPDDERIILETRELRTEDTSDNTPPDALLFVIVEKDTNGDNVLNARDDRLFALTLPDGSNFTRLDGITGKPLGEHVNRAAKALTIITESEPKITAHTVDLATFKVSGSVDIQR